MTAAVDAIPHGNAAREYENPVNYTNGPKE
jgi:hypothetical protein